MKTRNMRIWGVACFLFLLGACDGANMLLDPAQANPFSKGAAGGISYESDIVPLFKKRCASCHGPGSAIPNWLDYDVALKFSTEIYRKVFVEKTMPMSPFDAAMTDSERKLVADWVNAGSPRTSGVTVGPMPAASPSAPGPNAPSSNGGGSADFERILPVLQQRCATCHNAQSSVPNWLDYNTASQYRSQIYQRVVQDKTMPPNNSTGITEDERKLIGDWAQADGQSPSPPSGGGGATPPPSPTPAPCLERLSPALLEAVSLGDPDEVSLLLGQGACPNTKNAQGVSVLLSVLTNPNMLGFGSNYIKIVRSLLGKGADANVSFNGGSAVIWATFKDYREIAESLVDHDADVNVQVRAGSDAGLSSVLGYTPLMLAVQTLDLDVAKTLLNHGAEVNVKLSDGTTARSLAEIIQNPSKKAAFKQLLSEYGDIGSPATVTYANDILPIFKLRCALCHNDGTPDLNWLNYDTAYAKRAKIFDRVTVKKDMPAGGNATHMTDQERNLVGKWVQSGAAQ